MPCVFPVLSIKALSLVKIADKHPELARLHGLSYTAGVVLSFVAIAGALIALQTAGAGVGWGFHLQNPIVVTLLAYLLFIIGLNLSGLFEFGGEFVNIGGKLTQGSGYWKAKTKIIAVIAFISAIALLPVGELAQPKNSVVQSMEFGETYSPEKLEALLSENSPIFVEMTAAWCITCKVNHAIAINTDATKKLFAGTKVRYLIGDWTNQDLEITKYLNRYGRNGVPIYVYYGPKDAETGTRPDPKVLPQILTPGIVKNAITNQ
jgi:thiol:disulfide interchange protein